MKRCRLCEFIARQGPDVDPIYIRADRIRHARAQYRRKKRGRW